MAGTMFALLIGLQATAAPPAQAPVHPPARPGMIYNDLTGSYVPIIGWRPRDTGPHQVPRGTKLEYRRLGEKISEAPIGH